MVTSKTLSPLIVVKDDPVSMFHQLTFLGKNLSNAILKKHFVLHTLHCYAPILPPVVSNCYFLGNRFRQEALKSQWKFLTQNTTAKL
ncbi:predicted protein [Arabidopsis lyrata subsp. lyrata]|uniref:Predicted protein n=1 Tax=Arabidopsis lyrata subsp. lyrata TaxID=81972 RepID=D7MF18_ARALL|nr:predicted protein [Arabidopsis lyrata subsp. lyrata]